MARKRYEYPKTIEGTNTLGLVLDFERLSSIEMVRDTYNILATKGRGKSRYITSAIEYYDATSWQSRMLHETLDLLNISATAKKAYGLKSDKAIRELLSIDLNSDKFKEIESKIPSQLPAMKMLCGFRMDDPRLAAMHERLFNMSMNERLELVTDAVMVYVMSGEDPETSEIMMHRFVRDSIIQYHIDRDKDSAYERFKIMVNAKSCKITKKQIIKERKSMAASDHRPQNLHIRFQKYYDMKGSMADSFAILKSKGHHNKSEYLSKAIPHFDETQHYERSQRKVCCYLRCMKFIKSFYSLSDIQSVENLLSMGTDSATFADAEKRMLKGEEPRYSMLGFDRNDPEAVQTYKRLMEINASERAELISEAVRVYVEDGLDMSSLMKLSFRLVYQTIREYENAPDKRKVAEGFYALLSKAEDAPLLVE